MMSSNQVRQCSLDQIIDAYWAPALMNVLRCIVDDAINTIRNAAVIALTPNPDGGSLDENISKAVRILLHAGMKKPNGETYPPTLILAWYNIRLAALCFEPRSAEKEGRTPSTGDLAVFKHFAARFGLPSFVTNKALGEVLTSLRSTKISREKIRVWATSDTKPVTLTAMKRDLKMIQEVGK